MDVLYLLLKEIFFLLLVEFFASLLLNLLFELRKLTLAVEHLEEFVSTLFQVVFLEQFIFICAVQRNVGANEVDEENGMRDVSDGKAGVFGASAFNEFEVADDAVTTSIDQGSELFVGVFIGHFLEGLDFDTHQGGAALHLEQSQGTITLQNRRGMPGGQVDGAHDTRQDTFFIEV